MQGKIGINGTLAAVPVQAGPQWDVEKNKKVAMKFDKGPNFVIGYRLLRIKAKKDGTFMQKSFNRWALLDDDVEPAKKKTLDETWYIEELRGPEEGMDKYGITSTVDDDGGQCNLIAKNDPFLLQS